MSASKNLIQAAAGVGGGDFYPHTVDNSARFNESDSAYLYRTAGTPTDQNRFTCSTWFKNSKPTGKSTNHCIFSAGNSYGYAKVNMSVTGAGSIRWNYDSTSMNATKITNALHRDSSAWYHLVFAVDTDNATANDRVKIYVNGVRLTSFSSDLNPGSGDYYEWNQSGQVQNIGRRLSTGPTSYIDLYLAQTAMVDGQQLDPTSFGEFKNGIWVPKDLSGLTFGNNGFWLDFADSSNFGNDVSGNNNDWTSSGLTSSDQMIDTPTNNFLTAVSLVPRTAGGTAYAPTPSDGNLRQSGPNSSGGLGVGFPQSGKWYYETRYNGGGDAYPGLTCNPGSSTDAQGAGITGSYIYYFLSTTVYGSGNEYRLNGTWSGGSNHTTGDIIGWAVDMDNGTFTTYVNGTQNVNHTWSSTDFDTKDVRLAFGGGNGHQLDYNFGQNGTFNGTATAQGNADENGIGDFYYTPPSGYLACCSQNMPELTIGPNSATTSDENFDTALYTGNGGTTTVSSLNFQPDLTWIKSRTYARYHALADVLRGSTKFLSSNSTSAEDTVDSGNGVVWNSTGFEVDASSDWNSLNESGANIVAWNWKGNGSGVSNTDGTITSTVSANQNAGISIVGWAGTGAGSATVGHGLGVEPSVVITKQRGSSPALYNWLVYHKSLGASYYLSLNTNSASVNDTGPWSNTAPSSTVITLGTTTSNWYYVNNYSGTDYIAYAFAEVEGFSSFGKYTGNGSSDGSFIYTGFRPAFIYIKSSSLAQSGIIKDTEVSPYNVSTAYNQPDSSAAEVANHTATYTDILSNGFKLRGSANATNASGATYIYMAFAENPFKYSNAR